MVEGHHRPDTNAGSSNLLPTLLPQATCHDQQSFRVPIRFLQFPLGTEPDHVAEVFPSRGILPRNSSRSTAHVFRIKPKRTSRANAGSQRHPGVSAGGSDRLHPVATLIPQLDAAIR